MVVLRVILGAIVGFGIPFGTLFLILHFAFHVANAIALGVAGACGLIGAVYSAVAFGRGIYGLRPFSILGYVLDMSWSLLNTTASLFVWLPACAVAGGAFVPPDDKSRRSGTFVYEKNPRDPSGLVYGATTIGTVIGGGWSSHEEMHVWQARLFGLLYLPVYGLSWLLNALFRLCTGKVQGLAEQAYFRICFEEWAYSAGSSSRSDDNDKIQWGAWILWFFLSSIYVASVVLIFVGAFAGMLAMSITAAGVLFVYSLIRALTPPPTVK